ncbi:hypothetical protein [Amycolatopsis sp. NPDC004079]|uniref:hypothetical protein n=1 Tax=Amycolatopsis sp. NPDC004079 TaxID=3154549 RepID=UPI0033BB17F1
MTVGNRIRRIADQTLLSPDELHLTDRPVWITTRTLFSYVGLTASVAPAAQEDLPGWIDSPARKI